jgi:hypothetical protein
MSRKKVKKSDISLIPFTSVKWLKADYHFHVFHYRMPETVATASITSFVPSPLTVKMSMIASLLQSGDVNSAKRLAPWLPQIDVRIVPPYSAFSFKAFLRYRSVPAVESANELANTNELDETGSYYYSRPHTREFALFQDKITVFLGLPEESLLEIAKRALKNVRYLGCKDSLVTCLCVEEVTEDDVRNSPVVQRFQEGVAGIVVLGADFNGSAAVRLRDLIPSLRDEEHYFLLHLVLPGRIFVKGRTRIFKRNDL